MVAHLKVYCNQHVTTATMETYRIIDKSLGSFSRAISCDDGIKEECPKIKSLSNS